MRLHGIHHLTAVTADAPGNHAFYTGVLGMRLVKKTVNQDDVSAYHLFYADGAGNPGTDLTFFNWPAGPERRGAGAVSRTGLRVPDAAALDFWQARLAAFGVPHAPPRPVDGRLRLDFQDPEGQRLCLVTAEEPAPGDFTPWHRGPVPAAHQVRGLGPVTVAVRRLAPTRDFVCGPLGMAALRTYPAPDAPGAEVHVFATAGHGPAAELHVQVEPDLPPARPGAGGVHHVAFRIPDADYDAWADRLQHEGVPNSGPVDRFWFRSLYARDPAGILFEIATNGPGFTADEPVESLGESLVLPPALEPRRREIESALHPIDAPGRPA